MRIAIFTETFLPKWDGVANTLCYLLEHLATRGHASLMFAPRPSPHRHAATPIIRLPSFPFPMYPELQIVPPLIDVEKQLAAFGADVVHLINPTSLGLVGLRHARTLGLPVVASYHTDIPGYAEQYGLGLLRDPLWAYFRWLHNQADLNLCPSRFTQIELEEHGFERVQVWGRGVDTHRFAPAHRNPEWRDRLSGGCPEAPLLLYVGRLASEKRVDRLRPVLDALPEARLALVGDGPMRESLQERFAGTHTTFAGYLKGQDLACAYASSDLFVFPSANETFGNVILEAMASGLPVVAVRSGGPVDHVFDGQNGYLVDPGDVSEMIARVQQILVHSEERRQLAAGALVHAQTLTWEAVLDKLLDQYASLIRRQARPRLVLEASASASHAAHRISPSMLPRL